MVHTDLKRLDDIERFLKLAAAVPDRKHHILTKQELAERKLAQRRTAEVEEL